MQSQEVHTEGDTGGAAPLQLKSRSPEALQAAEVRSAHSEGDTRTVATGGFAGSQMPLPYRQEMETAFGRSFSSVQAFGDTNAARANEQLGSEAFAMGDRVAFRTPSPDKAVVAHELAHTVQQGGSQAEPQTLSPGARDACETEANEAALAAVQGERAEVRLGAPNVAQTGLKAVVDWVRRKLDIFPPTDLTELVDWVGKDETPKVRLLTSARTSLLAALDTAFTEKEPTVDKMIEIRGSFDRARGASRRPTRGEEDPQTMPGIAQATEVADFRDDFKTRVGAAMGLGTATPQTVAAACLAVANTALGTVHVEHMIGPLVPTGGAAAAFNQGGWSLSLREDIVQQAMDNVDTPQGNARLILARKTLHESRHAEQFMLLHRHYAGEYRRACNQSGDRYTEVNAIEYIKQNIGDRRKTNHAATLLAAAQNPLLAFDNTTGPAQRVTDLEGSLGSRDEVGLDKRNLNTALTDARLARTNLANHDNITTQENRRDAKRDILAAHTALENVDAMFRAFASEYRLYLGFFHEREARNVEALLASVW